MGSVFPGGRDRLQQVFPMALKTCGFGILGVGMYAPEEIISNADLEKMVDTNDEWITSRTGIKERRRIGADQATTDMAIPAARQALENAGMKPAQLDLIICCTFSPDYTVPCAACMIQDDLGLSGKCAAFDLNAACSGFTYGLSVATSFMRAGVYKTALVIGADAVTRSLDYTDRNTCVLFGDGAGAAVVGPTGPNRGLLGEHLCADGSLGENLIVFDKGSRIRTEEEKAAQGTHVWMDGTEVFKFATRVFGPVTRAALDAANQGLTVDDIDLLIPHQANLRIIESAAKKMGIPMEKVFVNIQRYGNTSAASIPMALAEAVGEGRLKEGDLVAMVAFGGGLTYAANIWVW